MAYLSQNDEIRTLCKAVYTGSIPVDASKSLSVTVTDLAAEFGNRPRG